MQHNFKTIQENNEILATAQRLGLSLHRVNDHEYRGLSLEPGNNDTCLSVDTDEQLFYDFKMDVGGDVIDLAAYVLHGVITNYTRIEAAQWLNPNGESYSSNNNERIKQRDEFIANIKKWHEQLLNDTKALDYVHSRGITNDTIEKYQLGLGRLCNGKAGQEMRLVIPYFNQRHDPVYAIHRAIPGYELEGSAKYYKLKENAFLRNQLLGLDTIPTNEKDCDLLLICEGVLDALIAIQAGYHVLCPAGGYCGKKNIELMVDLSKKFRRVITTFDHDEAENESGQKFTVDTGMKLIKAGVRFECVPNFGQGNKDLNDFVCGGGNIEELLEHTMSGAIFIAQQIKGHESFYELSANGRNAKLKDIREFHQNVKSAKIFSDQELKAIAAEFQSYLPSDAFKDLTKEPSISQIAMDYAEKYLTAHEGNVLAVGSRCEYCQYLTYDTKLGYYALTEKGGVHHELKKLYGVDARLAGRVENEIYNSAYVSRIRWEAGNYFNMRNGILNLDTGKLLPHTHDKFFNNVTDFDYDSQATSEEIEAFVTALSNGNQSRRQTLRDMLGYLLCPDNRAQCFFALSGRGNNGKSTLASLLTNIFGGVDKKFATSIGPNSFNNPNELIALEPSIVNVFMECNAMLNKQQCQTLKLATGGDALRGNFKFKDGREFVTRAKFILGTNETLELADTSYGMQRRTVFVKLERDFSGATLNYHEQLLKNKAGVFNYIYQCYRDLAANGFQVRRCDDQKELLKVTLESSNDIADFWSNYCEKLEDKINSRTNVYQAYKLWCEGLRRYPVSQTKFTRLFIAYLGQAIAEKPDGKPWTTGNERAFNFKQLAKQTAQQTPVEKSTDNKLTCNEEAEQQKKAKLRAILKSSKLSFAVTTLQKFEELHEDIAKFREYCIEQRKVNEKYKTTPYSPYSEIYDYYNGIINKIDNVA